MNKSDADFAYTSVAMPSGGIFIPADEPLLVFPSIRAAERYIEVTDIETGVYSVAYGPRAEPYNITHVGKKAVVQSVAGSCRPDDLKPLLIRYLEAIGQNPNLDSSLDQLVKAVWDYERDFWAENLGTYDVVYAFLSPAAMPELWRKARAEMKPGTLLISNSFLVPGVEPDRIVPLAGRGSNALYLYRL